PRRSSDLQQADLFALSPQRESFFEKLLHATAGAAVAAAQPAVEEKVRFAQHRQQRMMAGTAVFARVVSFERTFLLAIPLKDGRIQVQGVALWARRQALHLPLGQWFVQALHLTHTKLAKQIADGVVGGKTVQAQQRLQRAISPQPTGVSEASGSHQH